MIGADRWIYRNDYPLSWGWFKFLPTYLPRIVNHLFQRMLRGYSNYDMWNGNVFLAELISETAYWHFVHYDGYHSSPDMTEEEWLDTLLEIRDGFAERNQFGGPDVSDHAWALLRENFYSLWD